jgi:transmembrane sensor
VRRTTWLLATAASLFIAVGGVAAWQFALSQKTATVASAGSPMREFRTARGQRATVVLLDGTRVVLGVDSRLRVAPLESGRRDIYLDGEAVFDVADDETRPFVVHAGTAVMRDLGTTFSVRAYPAEPVRVVVASGLVAIRDTSRPAAREALLSAGDAGWLHEDGSTEIERGIDPSPYMAWTEGRLVFRRAPLGEVVVQLQRWFDVQIAVKDSALLQATVNASFDGDKLDDALQLLAGSLDARVERRGRTATFRENR